MDNYILLNSYSDIVIIYNTIARILENTGMQALSAFSLETAHGLR